MAISNICAVTGYGDESNPITAALKAFSRANLKFVPESQDQPMQDASTATAASETQSSAPAKHAAAPNKQLPNALRLFVGMYDLVGRRFGDHNVLPFLHVTLVFVHHLTFCPDAMAYVAPTFPWKLTAIMLNTLLSGPATSTPSSSAQNVSQALAPLLEGARFPGSAEIGEENSGDDGKQEKAGASGAARKKKPLADDFALRGFPWTETYFPEKHFVTEERIDDDEKYFELPSMLEERRERLVWLGCRIAERENGKWLRFDKETKRFGVAPAYDIELDLDVHMPATPGESVDYGELPDAGTVA